jgi:hypothetical protein
MGHLSDEQLALLNELVRRQLQVEGSRALTDAARGIVVRAVARAEVAVVLAGVRDGHTAKVRADAKNDKPLRALQHAHVIGLRVAELSDVAIGSLRDLVRTPVSDEDRLTTPLDGHGLTNGNGAHIDLRRRKGQHVLEM